MGTTLYLIETRAQNTYTCAACNNIIPRGTRHFRHDPYPYARAYRGQKVTHWCRDCILASQPAAKDTITKRIRVPALRVLSQAIDGPNVMRIEPLRVELVGVAALLHKKLAIEPSLVHQLTPEQFEEFVCDRLFAMGLEARRTGATNSKDGGIDVLFWPRQRGAFPFLGAAQVKHHRNPERKEGSSTIRDFYGAISVHPINAGLVVTNTTFSPDAEWFARERAKLVRLRDFSDIRRWILNNFDDEAEWKELPKSIELCPGVIVDVRKHTMGQS